MDILHIFKTMINTWFQTVSKLEKSLKFELLYCKNLEIGYIDNIINNLKLVYQII